IVGIACAVALGLSLVVACGSQDGESSSDKSVKIAVAPGWADDVAVTHLWKHVLEEHGYDVDLQKLDPGPIFEAVSTGDLDLYLDVWLPKTHADYWNKYKDQVEDLGVWNDQATLNLAVPSYMDIDSIADLKGHADLFDGKITGIESGAGETGIVKNELIPDYGLEDEYTLQTSSTPAMLAALSKAIDNKKPIVVTLWHPHWAYNKFDIKDLKDPKGSMGEPEKLHIMASEDFVDNDPDLVAKLKDFSMDDEMFSGLMDAIDEDPDHPADAVDSWVQ